ncbi:hypothetical protein ACE1TI_10295 [Alteribacillus sp. JSM 102045]|uniref:hypothetical protein n=1 Tax=Alteribacillus sp. JSM 102045 TaxID=1562101 RepID=UPI0035C0BAC6
MNNNLYKVCLAQQCSMHGKVEDNKERCADTARKAAAEGAALLVFPELVLR